MWGERSNKRARARAHLCIFMACVILCSSLSYIQEIHMCDAHCVVQNLIPLNWRLLVCVSLCYSLTVFFFNFSFNLLTLLAHKTKSKHRHSFFFLQQLHSNLCQYILTTYWSCLMMNVPYTIARVFSMKIELKVLFLSMGLAVALEINSTNRL